MKSLENPVNTIITAMRFFHTKCTPNIPKLFNHMLAPDVFWTGSSVPLSAYHSPPLHVLWNVAKMWTFLWSRIKHFISLFPRLRISVWCRILSQMWGHCQQKRYKYKTEKGLNKKRFGKKNANIFCYFHHGSFSVRNHHSTRPIPIK